MAGDTESFFGKVRLLVIGACIGAIPVLINSQIQIRAQMKQLVFDRRIAALKDYAETCAMAIRSGNRTYDAMRPQPLQRGTLGRVGGRSQRT